MGTAALWVNLVGNLLVVIGLGWAGRSLLQAEKAIRRDKATLVEIKQRHRALRQAQGRSYDSAARGDELARSGIDFTTNDDMMYLNQDIQLAIISHLRPSVRGPFLATLIGTVVTLVAAVMSLG
jgi:hypothetical protein